jgi:autoinducer 2-degrading protein
MDPSQLTEFLVFITIKSGQEDAFLHAARDNCTGSVQEPGNLRFDMYRDAENAREYLFAEKYDSVEAVTAHRQTPHFLAFFKILEGMQEFPRRREPGNAIPPNYKPISNQ